MRKLIALIAIFVVTSVAAFAQQQQQQQVTLTGTVQGGKVPVTTTYKTVPRPKVYKRSSTMKIVDQQYVNTNGLTVSVDASQMQQQIGTQMQPVMDGLSELRSQVEQNTANIGVLQQDVQSLRAVDASTVKVLEGLTLQTNKNTSDIAVLQQNQGGFVSREEFQLGIKRAQKGVALKSFLYGFGGGVLGGVVTNLLMKPKDGKDGRDGIDGIDGSNTGNQCWQNGRYVCGNNGGNNCWKNGRYVCGGGTNPCPQNQTSLWAGNDRRCQQYCYGQQCYNLPIGGNCEQRGNCNYNNQPGGPVRVPNGSGTGNGNFPNSSTNGGVFNSGSYTGGGLYNTNTRSTYSNPNSGSTNTGGGSGLYNNPRSNSGSTTTTGNNSGVIFQ